MDFVYLDKRVAVCLKPAGVLSVDEPGGMPSLVRSALGDENACVRTVHRLDQVVGGLMVFARSRRAASELSRQMREGQFHKQYLAVVHGRPDPAVGRMEDLLGRDKATRRTYVANGPGKDVRPAVLDYETLDSAEGLSLIRIRLHTGRTHQIRCQFASRGLPLVGDHKYGTAGDECSIALWSYMLDFCHPETGERLCFIHEPPAVYPFDLFSTAYSRINI